MQRCQEDSATVRPAAVPSAGLQRAVLPLQPQSGQAPQATLTHFYIRIYFIRISRLKFAKF